MNLFAIVIVIIIWLFIRGERTGILMPDSFFRTASI